MCVCRFRCVRKNAAVRSFLTPLSVANYAAEIFSHVTPSTSIKEDWEMRCKSHYVWVPDHICLQLQIPLCVGTRPHLPGVANPVMCTRPLTCLETCTCSVCESVMIPKIINKYLYVFIIFDDTHCKRRQCRKYHQPHRN